jgi:hypothetical protein
VLKVDPRLLLLVEVRHAVAVTDDAASCCCGCFCCC